MIPAFMMRGPLAAIARLKELDRGAGQIAMPRPGADNAHARSPVLSEEKSELAAAFQTFRSAVVGIGLFSAVSNVLMLTGPLFMLEIYDRVLPSRSVPTLVLLLLLVAMLFAAQGVIDWIRARMMVRIGSALDETLSSRVHQMLVRLALRGGKAEGLEPVRDLDSIRSYLSGLGPTALFDLPWILSLRDLRPASAARADRTRRLDHADRARSIGGTSDASADKVSDRAWESPV
jgi:hypothetical protein